MGTTTKPRTTRRGKGTTRTTTPPQCTFVKPVPVTPVNRKGTSTVQNPVGVTWVNCINLTLGNKGVTHKRSYYTQQVLKVGVTYYTVRTQVNLFIKWVNNGCNPTQLPKGVTLPKGFKPFKTT